MKKKIKNKNKKQNKKVKKITEIQNSLFSNKKVWGIS